MIPGAQSICNIAVYGSDTHFVDLIHGLAGRSDTVLEFDRDRCVFFSSVTI